MRAKSLAIAATACLSIALTAAGTGASQAFADTALIDSAATSSLGVADAAGDHGADPHSTDHAQALERFARPAQTRQTAQVPQSATAATATTTVGCGPNAGADLQAAVDGAASGATLLLAPHCVYSISTPDAASTDSALYVNKTLTINGRNATIERSTLAASDFRVVRIDSPGVLTLLNTTITGGRATYPGTDGDGGGIELNGSGAALTLTSSTVTANTAETGGGGIENNGGTLTSYSSTISDNVAGNGGGGLEQGTGRATFNSGRITDNTADASIFGYFAAGGGAVRMIDSGTLTLNGTTVSGNAALTNLTFGGAVENIYGTVNVNSSPIRNNRASGSSARGGAFSNLETLNVNASPVSGNTANGTSSGGLGGALSEDGGPATIINSPIMSNTASGPGAAGGGIYDDFGPVNLIASPVLRNTPDNCSPAGAVTGCTG